MATLPTPEDNACEILSIFAGYFNCRPGEVLSINNIHSVWLKRRRRGDDLITGMQYAREQSWIEQLSGNENSFRLTEAGFAAAESVPSLSEEVSQKPNPRRLIKAFISYSHKDADLLSKLHEHLSALKRQQLLETWTDRQIQAGGDINVHIEEQLNDADLYLLLVSSAFIESNYCFEKEFAHALAREQEGKAIIVPIIVRECDWNIPELRKFKALPDDGRAVTSRHWHTVDEAFTNIATGLRDLLEKGRGVQTSVPEPPRCADVRTALQNRRQNDFSQIGSQSSGLSQAAQEIIKLFEGESKLQEPALHVIKGSLPGDPTRTGYFIGETTATGSSNIHTMKTRLLEATIGELITSGCLDAGVLTEGKTIFEYIRQVP